MRRISLINLTNLSRAFGIPALMAFTAVNTVFADNISKTFEFGPGTSQSRSHVRTFNIPCGTEGGIAAVVKFIRLGADGDGNNIPIVIELREPDTAAEQEGPIADTKTANAIKTEQTVTLRSPSSTRGCSLPWRVRVRYSNEGPAPAKVYGTARLDFDGRVRNILSEGVGVILAKGSTKTIKLGDTSGMQQGTIDITANWDHSLYGARIPGPNPVKLRWALINPSGVVVNTVEAYSSDEARSELTKFRMLHRVTRHTSGQWNLRITNLTNDDATGFELVRKFTPGCP